MPEASIRRIGKYEIRAELGRGGFGKVYRAYDPSVGRLVAIKVLTAEGNKDLLTRFRNEAAAAGNLRHKNIVTIYDFGDHNGLPYLVMEFLEGEDLQHVISTQKPVPLLQKVNIMTQVADGLYCAHSNGVVHRDVKPGNIRLLPDGSVKIMDFGIARLLGDAIATRLTRQGHVIGTLMYMAPEQVMGSDVDFLCDIFAYGTTYYEFLTGKHPFQAADPRAVFFKITAEDPEPIRSLAPECPEALEQIVRRALHKERELRYQSFRDVQFDSEPILMELRQEQATARLVEAKELFDTEQLETAQAVVGEALALDPANREARHLRETIQNRLTRRLLQPRIDALLSKAEEALTQRRFSESLDSVEAAFRLDRTNSVLQGRLDHIRGVVNRNKKVIRLVAEARTDFAKQDLQAAACKLQDALDLDPDYAEARQFVGVVQAEVERREKLKVLQEKIREAGDLLRQEAFDKATALLNTLEPDFRNRQDVQDLVARIREKKVEFERRQQLMAAMERVGALLQDGRHEESIQQLEQLQREFPEEQQIPKLLQYARNELRARQKAEALQKLDQDVRACIAALEFESAIKLIDDALARYPNESIALSLREEVRRAEAAWRRSEALRQAVQIAQELLRTAQPKRALHLLNEAATKHSAETELRSEIAQAAHAVREEAIRNTKLRCAALAAENRFAEAIEDIETLLGEYPGETDLLELRNDLQRSWAVREAVQQADAWIRDGEPERAVDLLTGANARYPGEADLASAIARVQDAVRNKAIESLCAVSRQHAQAKSFDQAIGVLDEGLRTYPDDNQLIELKTIQEALRDSEVLCSQKLFKQALLVIDACVEIVGTNPALAEQRQRIEIARAEEVRELVHQAGALIRDGEPARAVELLTNANARYPGEPDLASALSRAQDAQAIQEALRESEALCSQKLFKQALQVIETCAQKVGAKAALAEQRQRIERMRADALRELVQQADALIREGEPEHAVEFLTDANARYPGEPDLASALSRAQDAQAIQEALRESEALCSQKLFKQALHVIETCAQKVGTNPALAEQRRRIERKRAEAIRELVQQADASIGDGEPEHAVELLTDANARYPGEADLASAFARAQEAVRNKAIESLCAAAGQKAQAKSFEAALTLLEEGLRIYAGDKRLLELKAATAREQAIQKALQESEALCSQKLFEKALKVLEACAQKVGTNPALAEQRRRIEIARAEAIRELVQQADAMIRSGDPEHAAELLTDANSRYPGEADLASAFARAEEAVRNKTIDSLCAAVRQQGQAKAFENALSLLDEGLRTYAADKRLLELKTIVTREQTNEAVRALLQQADALIRDGAPGQAVELLTDANARYPGEPDLATAIVRAQELARNKAVESLCASARQHALTKSFDDALRVLDGGLKAYPGDKRLLELKVFISREQAIQEALREAEAFCSQKLFEKSLQTLDLCAKKVGTDAALSEQRRLVELAWRKQQRLDALARAIKDADERVDKGQPERAVALLQSAAAQYAGQTELADALARAREAEKRKVIDQVCNAAQEQLERNAFDRAIELVDEALNRYPDDNRLTQYKESVHARNTAWQRAQEIRTVLQHSVSLVASKRFAEAIEAIDACSRIWGEDAGLSAKKHEIQAAWEAHKREEEARTQAAIKAKAIDSLCAESVRHLEAGEFDQSIKLLEAGLSTYPGESRLTQLKLAALESKAKCQREEAIQETLRRCVALAATERFHEALGAIETALRKYGRDPALIEAQQRLKSDWERHQRADAILRAVHGADDLMARGQPGKALSLLQAAAAQYNDDPELAAALARAQQAVALHRKEVEVENVCRETRLHIEAREFDDAEQVVEKALQTYGGQDALTKLRETVLVAKADWERERQVREVPAVEAVEAETVEKLCRETRLYIEAKDFNAAEREVEQALQKHSGEFRLTQLRETVLAARADWEAELKRTRALPAISQTTQAVTDEVIIPEPSHTFTAPPTPPEPPSIHEPPPRQPREFLLPALAGLIVVVGVIGYFAYRSGHTVQPDIVLEILSTPSGAAVRVGNKSCITPDCRLPLAPGQYNVEIAKEGFETKVEAISLEPRMTGSKLETTLTPKPVPVERAELPEQKTPDSSSGSLIVDTGAETATVLIDGKPLDRQAKGTPLELSLAPKSYTVRVEKPGYDAKPNSLRVQVKSGAQVSARFRLEPKDATLAISDLPLGTKVTFDGRLAEIVGADGTFRMRKVTPGEHKIELSKDGFFPVLIARAIAPGDTLALGKQDIQFVAIPPPPKKEEPRPPKVEVPSVPKPDPIAIENQAWQAVRNTKSPADLENFLKAHPNGRNAQAARSRLEQLEFEMVPKTDRGALERFAVKYRDGKFAQQARDEIARIDREIELQKKRTAEKLLAAADRDAIANVLKRYEEAYRGKDRDLLKSVWPGIPRDSLKAIEDAFKNFRSVSVEFRQVADPEISGDRASVKCRLIAESVDRNGPHVNQSTVLIGLVKKNSKWVIDAIKYL